VNLGLLDVYKYNRIVKAVIPWPSVEVKAVARALVLQLYGGLLQMPCLYAQYECPLMAIAFKQSLSPAMRGELLESGRTIEIGS
jgi:hypothetical protein